MHALLAAVATALTCLFARYSPRSRWPVFTTTVGLAALSLWVAGSVDSRPVLLVAGLASIFTGVWMFISALVPGGRKTCWKFAALFFGGSVFVAVGMLAWVFARSNSGCWLAWTVIVTGLVGALFLGFLAWSWIYRRIAKQWLRAQLRADTGPNAVIVLGARIVDGRLTRLLRRRVELGLEVAHSIWRTRPAPLVLSGGSPRPGPAESHVMAAYVRQLGTLKDLVIEDQSTTTAENFSYSVRRLSDQGVDEPFLGVTNNFHAYRAAIHMRRAGVTGHVIGGPSGSQSAPLHTLREFAAFFHEIFWPD